MTAIEHEETPDALKVWTYPANGSRYCYTFEKPDLELSKKTHTTNPATSEKRTNIVAPTITPAVKDYLEDNGFDY